MENLFLEASRRKLRFETNKGQLSTEDLWDLSLTNLDTLAKAVNKKLKEDSEESFITVRSKTNTELNLKLEILVFIIRTKQEEQEAAKNRLAKQAELSTLKELLVNKKMQELSNLTSEEIQAKIAALEA